MAIMHWATAVDWPAWRAETGEAGPWFLVVGPTLDQTRSVLFESGLRRLLPPGAEVRWVKDAIELTLWNGCIVKGLSSEKPDSVLGYNAAGAWLDELRAFADKDRSPQAENTTWSNLAFALRGGPPDWSPPIIATTSPRWCRLLTNPGGLTDKKNPGLGLADDPKVARSSMTTLANLDNLPDGFYEDRIQPWEGTFLYERDVLGKLVAVEAGALWSKELTDEMFGPDGDGYSMEYLFGPAGGVERLVLGVDPSLGAGTGDECGIVSLAVCRDGRAYVLADRSGGMPPVEWAKMIDAEYRRLENFRQRGRSIPIDVPVEQTGGYELVLSNARQFNNRISPIPINAKKSKQVRATPVSVLSERGLIRFCSHVIGSPLYEGPLVHQLRTWEPDEGLPSPDRLDAFVYAVRHGLADEIAEAESWTGMVDVFSPPPRR